MTTITAAPSVAGVSMDCPGFSAEQIDPGIVAKYNKVLITENIKGKITYRKLDLNKKTFVKNKNIIELLQDNTFNNINVIVYNKNTNETKHITLNKNNTFKQIMSQLSLLKSDLDSIEIYRKSIAIKQKANIDSELDFLSKRLANKTSGNSEEATIRSSEYTRMQHFIENARKVVPKGQIIISNSRDLLDLKLKNEDKIEISAVENIANIQGEIFFTNTFTINNTSLKELIKWSGGLTEVADTDKIFILNKNGVIRKTNNLSDIVPKSSTVFVMRENDNKNFLFFKDITTVMYQIALSASVLIQP